MIKKGIDLLELKKLKKCELHAHLFGSITQNQLLDLLKEKNFLEDFKEFSEIRKNINSIELIFGKIFKYLPKIIKTIDDLKKLIDLVFKNFIEDNVVYLEIRSSPKNIENLGYDKYFETIISKIKEYEKKIKVRYLVSINRSNKPDIYKNLISTIKKIKDYKKYIIGIDLSGDPSKNYFSDYKEIFLEAKKENFKISIHTPEIKNRNYEIKNMINFKPDRFGHFLYFQEEDLEKVISLKIPIEICPTSNQICSKDRDYHNFEKLIKGGCIHFTVCTDDLLLFESSLSKEWKIFGDILGLNFEECQKFIRKSFDYAFDQDCLKGIFD